MSVRLTAKCEVFHYLHSAVLQSLLVVPTDYVRKQKVVWCLCALQLHCNTDALEANGSKTETAHGLWREATEWKFGQWKMDEYNLQR